MSFDANGATHYLRVFNQIPNNDHDNVYIYIYNNYIIYVTMAMANMN